MRRKYKQKYYSTDQQRTMLAEERTLLAYLRTFLTIVGLAIVILRVYFEAGGWMPLTITFFASIATVIFIEEIMRHRGPRKNHLDIRIK